MTRPTYPGGKRFAFTIIDDTDVATVANIRPVYRLLEDLGMRVTKTVWPLSCPEGSKNFQSSETLEDPDYCAFVVDLQQRGFEVTWHGATMESSTRERTVRALEGFRKVFGTYPRVHVNHAYNRENLYWGASRIDVRLLKGVYGRLDEVPPNHYLGHVEGSPFWWGDLCRIGTGSTKASKYAELCECGSTRRATSSKPRRREGKGRDSVGKAGRHPARTECRP